MAGVNREYGKVVDGVIVYAPRPMKDSKGRIHHNPGAALYAEYGYFPIEKQYPNSPRRWTRLSIKIALAKSGMLDAAQQFLSSTEIADGYTAWEALTDCDYIEEGYGGADAWSALLDGAATALGKTRKEIDAFLDSIPTEEIDHDYEIDKARLGIRGET